MSETVVRDDQDVLTPLGEEIDRKVEDFFRDLLAQYPKVSTLEMHGLAAEALHSAILFVRLDGRFGPEWSK